MPVSAWMIEQLALQPGQRVLELAAGPGDTGFLSAELVKPAGTLLSSDASAAMLAVARERALALGVENVEFAQLDLEWIDLPTATVDAVLCRWGLMLVADPSAALREARRVIRPGGRIALAVWDLPERNPWATVAMRTLVELGHVAAPAPGAPGMFALAAPGHLGELVESAGFVEVVVEQITVVRTFASVEAYIEETRDLSRPFAEAVEKLSEKDWAEVVNAIGVLLKPFADADGSSLTVPGSSLLAAASA